MRLVIFGPNLALKSMPGGLKLSKIEPWSLQNRAWSPPRRYFLKTSNLSRLKNRLPHCHLTVGGGILGQLGSILEAQEPPKSRPKAQNIDVEKHVFDIDSSWFWMGF